MPRHGPLTGASEVPPGRPAVYPDGTAMHPKPCGHTTTGTVAWPRPADSAVWGASIACCDRKLCIRAANDWVRARTGHNGEYWPDGHHPALTRPARIAAARSAS